MTNNGENEELLEEDPKVCSGMNQGLLQDCKGKPSDDEVSKEKLKGDEDPTIELDINEYKLGDDDAPLVELFFVKVKCSKLYISKMHACKM